MPDAGKGPTVDINGGVYRYTWPSTVQIKLDKLREDSRNGITSEILVRYAGQHVHQVRYNLLSTRGRTDIAKYCAARFVEPDWDTLIEEVSIRTLTAFRAGEPVVRLGDVQVSDALRYRLMPFLVEREANLIYGEGGLGKSTIGAFFGTMVQEAQIVGHIEPEPGNVLYLDYEASKEDQARRFRKIYAGMNLGVPVEVMHRFCFQPLAHDIQEIQRVVTEHNIELVIVDSAGPACGGEPESAAAVIPFFTALRSLRITSLVVAHKAKNATGGGPFGSAYWWNLPRNIYEIKKVQEQGSSTIHLLLQHVKANDAPLMRPTGVRVEFDGMEGPVTVTLEDAVDVPEFAAHVPLGDRIANELKRGQLSTKDLADGLQVKEDAVRLALNRGRAKRFVRLPDGWGLVAREG